MPFLILTFLTLLCMTTPAAAQNSNIYLDAAAREHVRKARERQQVADLSIDAYKALSRERLSAGLRGLRRDRLMYRREVAGRIHWTREGDARIEILGAREAIPVAIKGVQLPSDLIHYMPHLAFDPAKPNVLFSWDDDNFVRHPLAGDAEEHYKFRTGSTTTIQLQDGRTVRLIELEIIPQRADPHLLTGSMWLEAETHAVVRAGFRLAKSIDILRDIEDDEDDPDDKPPKWLGKMSADVDYVTIEYSLYDLKWWMPRLMAFEGGARVGPMRIPIHYERTYADYEITAREFPETMPIAELLARDSVRRAQQDPCNHVMNISVGNERTDSTPKQQSNRCGRWEVVMSTDTAALLNSSELPGDAFAEGNELLTEKDLKDLEEMFEGIPRPPALMGAPEVSFSLVDLGMARYNRVEGFSIGPSATVDFGPYIVNAEARIGLADLEPNFEFNVQRPGEDVTLTLGAYRRLNSTDPWRRPFSIGNSLSSLFFGRDDADFYRALGVELRGDPAGSAGGNLNWRVYAQTERVAEVETDFSVRRLIDNSYRVRPNVVADKNDALGGEVMWRFQRGLNPTGFRFGCELYAHASTGTFDFGRGALTLRFGIPLPGPFDMATEYAAGSTTDAAPIQHNWYIGGTSTVRGYNAAQMIGEAFWRGRLEVGYGLPAFRLVGFSDAGWAGARDDIGNSKPLLSVGAGVSFLDGLLRFDIARGVRAPKGWAATLYFDAAL